MQSDTENINQNPTSPLVSLIERTKLISAGVLRKWKLIVLVIALGAAYGFIKAYKAKTIYKAVLTFAIEDDRSGGGGLSGALGLASTLGFDLGTNAGGAFSGLNLLELMKSRLILEKALLNKITYNNKEINLATLYLQTKDTDGKLLKSNPLLFSEVEKMSMVNRTSITRFQDSVLKDICESLASTDLKIYQKDKKVSIFTIETLSENEFFSKSFTENIAAEVSQYYVDIKSKKAKNNVLILEKQVDSVKSELNGAIAGVASANDGAFNLNPAFGVKRVPSNRRQVDVQANTAILTQLVVNLELARVTLRKETPLVQVIDSPTLPLSTIKVGKLKSTVLYGALFGFVLVVLISLNIIVKAHLRAYR